MFVPKAVAIRFKQFFLYRLTYLSCPKIGKPKMRLNKAVKGLSAQTDENDKIRTKFLIRKPVHLAPG